MRGDTLTALCTLRDVRPNMAVVLFDNFGIDLPFQEACTSSLCILA